MLLGIGFYGHPLLLLLVPIFMIFLIVHRINNKRFIIKEMCKALFLMLILISPYLFWCYQNGFDKWKNEHLLDIGFSLRTFQLYFGEIIAWLSERLPGLFFYGHISTKRGGIAEINGKLKIIIDGSGEYPVVNWLLGILIFTSIFYCLRRNRYRKENLISFSLIIYIFIFIITSIMSGGYSFDDHWWATMSIYPGVILCSTMLVDFKKRYKYGRYLIYILIVYFILNALCVINLRRSGFLHGTY